MVYLGTTRALWLTFGRKWTAKSITWGYCDVDWAGQPHRHLISGYSFHIGQGAVTWSSKKQYIIALLSTESEYIVLAHATKEGLWMHTFLSEIQDVPREMVELNSDNQGAIALSKDNKLHQQMKHIDIRYHFIHEAVEDGQIRTNYVPTDQNPADIFTKPLSKMKFCGFVTGLGLKLRRRRTSWVEAINAHRNRRSTDVTWFWCGDIPRMWQRSVEIGDLSVNPMWFWGVQFWSSEMVSWCSIKECEMEVWNSAIRWRVSGVQDRAKVQRCEDRAKQNDEMRWT